MSTRMGMRGIGMGEILDLNREPPFPERGALSLSQHPHPGPPRKGEGVDWGSRSFGMIPRQRQEQNNVR